VHDILANLRSRSTIFDEHDAATTAAAPISPSLSSAKLHDDSSHEQRAKQHADEQKQQEQPQQHSDDDHIPPHLWLLQNLPTRDLRLDFAARVLRHTEREDVLGRATGVGAEDLVDAHHCEATCLWLTALAECALEHMRPSTVPESALAVAAAVAGGAAVTPVRIRHEVFNMIASSSHSAVRANLAAALDDAATASLPVAAAAPVAGGSDTAVAAPASPQSGGTDSSSTLSARLPANSDEALAAASMPPPPVPLFDTASEPTEHSAAESESVSDETVAFTRHLLRMFLPSSSLRSEARLRCPDFALMHELFVALAEQAGFGEGVFDQPVPQAEVAESKEQANKDAAAADAPLKSLTHGRAAWLTSALRYAGLANGSVLPYTASELLDGRHPVQAHACLQRFIALALDHNTPAAQLLQRFKAGEVPAVRSAAAPSVRY
jgi:hypothetical protein